MKTKNVLVSALLLVLLSATAYAGVLDNIKQIFTDGVVLAVLSFVIGLGFVVKYTDWVSTLLITLGSLCTAIGLAISDHKVTKEEKEEIAAIFASLKDVVKKVPKNG